MKKRILNVFVFAIVFLSAFILLDNFNIKASVYDARNTYVYEMDVDNPLSIEELIGEIELNAIYDEDYISSCIVLVNDDNYIKDVLNKTHSFMRKLGEYILCFEVTSQIGVTSRCEIVVNVKDINAPILIEEYGKTEYTFLKSELINGKANDVILNSVLAYDNCDIFNVKIEVEEVDWETLEGGKKYSVNLNLYDSHDNMNEVEIKINVINDCFISFTMDSPYSIVKNDENIKTTSLIALQNIKAYDGNGKALKVSLDGEYSEYLVSSGINVITFKASDENGNTSTTQHIVYVINTNAPYFTLDESKILVYSNELFTSEKLEALIKMRANSNRHYTYRIINDQYSENYDKEGQYEYELELTYLNEDGSESLDKQIISFVMEVVKREEISDELESNKNFFNVIKKIGQIIYHIIKWPIVVLETYL